jgi:hypothetical protein
MKFAALRVIGQRKIWIFLAFSVDLGMKTGNKLKDTQVYLTGNPKVDTT